MAKKPKETPRYRHFAVKGGKKILQAFSESSEGYWDSVNNAFRLGEVTAGKYVDDIDELGNSFVILDTWSAKILVRDLEGTEKWIKPWHNCPDCSGKLELRKKFFAIGNPSSPFKYLCSNHPDNCKTVIAANTGGDLLGGVPADKKTREARGTTSSMFNRLWEEAPEIQKWSGNPYDPDDKKDLMKITNACKARAYRFLAKKMEEEGATETSIMKMDIPQLRIAYRICRDSPMSEVLS